MRTHNLLILFVLTSFLISCSGGKQISTTIQEGQTAYQSGQYESALKHYEEVIAYYNQNDNSKECPVYFEAADAAIQLGQKDKAIDYLKKDQYSNHINPETYYALADLYREKDNLSKELDELESYETKFPEGNRVTEVRARLFDLYVESENFDKALTSWDQLSEDEKNSVEKLEGYFKVNKVLDNDSVCDAVALKLLNFDENNLSALEWMAKKYFWKAEKRYAAELKAYEANKTNKQYKQLLKALDQVSIDFKTSLGYFKKIYLVDPEPQYAKYLGDIYNRLDDKKKADYYYRLAKGND